MVSRLTLLGALAAVGVVVVAGAGLGAALLFEEPSVGGVDVRWGEITQETAEIRATVVVDNPNAVGVPGVIDIEYTASLNGVAVAEGVKEDVGLSTGRNEIELVIPVDNRKIPAWWVTHVNGGERSTLSIDATVEGPFGIAAELPTQTQSVETDILGSLGAQGTEEVSLFGEPVLTLGDRTATWGEATAESTPLTVATEVTNRHDAPLRFHGVGYAVTMNGLTMGEGEDTTGLTVQPGETGTLEIDAALATAKIDDWWVSHLQANETTTLAVRTYAIVEGDGDDPTVELDLLTLEIDLRTDLLGGGGASTSDVSTTFGGGLEYETPAVSLGGLAWGEVTDDTTEIEASLTVDNPNTDSPLNEVVDLQVDRSVTINGVPVADGVATVEDLPAGQATRQLSVGLDNSKVPRWWAAHVNNGETSIVTIDAGATVDVGVTSFDLDVPDEQRSFSTDLLAGMNGVRDQRIQFEGEDVATVRSTAATWGQATAQETPIDASVTIRNDRDFVDVTVRDVSYTMTMNSVTVADGTDPASVTIAPSRTDTLAFTIVIDSQRMDEWWVSHIENGETTTIGVELTATIEIGGETQTVTIDLLGGDETVTTDILGGA